MFQRKKNKNVVVDNPYDVRGRGARRLESQDQGMVRSLSKISQFSRNSDPALGNRTEEGSAKKKTNNNTQQVNHNRKLDADIYRSGSYQFKSDLNEPGIVRGHMRQTSFYQSDPRYYNKMQ